MMNNNENLKNRFMERHVKLSKTIPVILDGIKMLESINPEEDNTEIVQNYISNLSNYDINDEEINLIKQGLNEFISNHLSKNEAVAYLNHLHDVTYFKAKNMLLIQKIFKCYF